MNEQINFQDEEPRLQLKYVTQFAELFLNPKLNKIDCLVFNLVELYDKDRHCYASNQHLANILNVSTTTISISISKLIKEGYLEQISFDGRNRVICIKADYKESKRQLLRSLKGRLKEPLKLLIKDNNLKINNKRKESSSKEEDNETDVSSTASLKKPIRLHKRKSKLLRQTKPNIPIKEKQTKPFIPNERALRLLTIWEKKGLKAISHKPETKAYKNSLIAIDRLLSGKAFNGSEYEAYQNYKFTTKEIMQAIDRFAMMALNPDYEPRNIEYKKTLAKTYFSDFIFNSFKSENGYGRSMFLYCLNNEAKIIKEKDIVIEDKYPKLTKAIMNLYKDKILGIDNFQFTNSDMNDFRKASILAWELFEKNKNRLMGSYRNMDAFQIAKTIFEALEQSGANPTKVKPYWLCNAVMKKQLPAYLYQSAILQGSSNESLSKPQAYYDFGKPFSE